MVNKEIIAKRLEKLKEYLAILATLKNSSQEEFTSNIEKYAVAERFLHLAIEATLDIGNHIISDKKLGEVDVLRDIPRLFSKFAYISDDLCKKWMEIAGFRNILVHDYMRIDRIKIYKVLRNNLNDLEELLKFFAQFL